jgi:hypothetical protein
MSKKIISENNNNKPTKNSLKEKNKIVPTQKLAIHYQENKLFQSEPFQMLLHEFEH